jgi:hypothetical protein
VLPLPVQIDTADHNQQRQRGRGIPDDLLPMRSYVFDGMTDFLRKTICLEFFSGKSCHSCSNEGNLDFTMC